MKWFFAFLFLALPAMAQPMQVVSSCGAVTLLAGDGVNGFVDTTGHLCTSDSGGGGGSVTQGTTPWVETPLARTSVTSSTLEANHIITASAGSLYSFEVQADSTLSAAAWWIMIYNATTPPADGAVAPIKCYQMGSGVLGANFAFPNPVAFSTGIVIGISTTGCFTKTASAHAFISGDF